MIDAGGNPQQLTDDIEIVDPNGAYAYDLFWSEDGQSIYYVVWEQPKRPSENHVYSKRVV